MLSIFGWLVKKLLGVTFQSVHNYTDLPHFKSRILTAVRRFRGNKNSFQVPRQPFLLASLNTTVCDLFFWSWRLHFLVFHSLKLPATVRIFTSWCVIRQGSKPESDTFLIMLVFRIFFGTLNLVESDTQQFV